MDTSLQIGDLISVPQVRTIIRLEEGRTRSRSILESFVLTDDVSAHFTVLSEALLKEHGRGFFLQGDFGSGKSHFLAALTAWLTDQPGAGQLTNRHQGLKRLKKSEKKFLTVELSLLEYRAARSIEQVMVKTVEAALADMGIESCLTPLAAFIANLKALLKNENLAADFAVQNKLSPEEIDTFLQKQPRRAYTAGVRFMKDLGLPLPETLVEERHETFERITVAVRDSGFDGMLLIIDELSEFFSSKPDARALNEDARTLQLLGEMTATTPLWIIAAVQESIERTGDIAQVTFRKIKDRFPIKFSLSTLHIKALISRRLVVLKPGAKEQLHTIYDYLQRQFPLFVFGLDEFMTVYPVHPKTIALLDGLGDLFSVHRGIVDFVHSRLAGDPARQITGILDRPAYEMLGPDSIYDHFSGRIAEISSLNAFPRHVVPHFDSLIKEVIEDVDDRPLARRIIRVLVLYAIHPTADSPTVRQLTEQVTCAISEQDPDLNAQFVVEAILDVLVEKSSFLTKKISGTDPLDAVYQVSGRENPGRTLKTRIDKTALEIPLDDTRLLTLPLAELPESPSWPGSSCMKKPVNRLVRWNHSERTALVAFIKPGETDSLQEQINCGLDRGKADFAMLISIGPCQLQMAHTVIWQIGLHPDHDATPVLREFLALQRIASGLRPENPADLPLIQESKEALKKQAPNALQAALDIFYAGSFSNSRMIIEPVLRQLKRFDRLLEIAGETLLEQRYPRFREIAPKKIAASSRVYQRLIDEFISPGRLSLQKANTKGLGDAIEGLARPLGLVELKSGAYIFSPDPEQHPLLVTLFSRISSSGPTPLGSLLAHLKTGIFGMPDDMAFFLLSALAHVGLVTLLKNNRAVPLAHLSLISVNNADAVAPGEVIGRHDRETLLTECTFLAPDTPWESLGLRQQREAWQAVIKFRDWAARTCVELEQQLAAVAEFKAFEGLDLKSLRSRLFRLKALADEIRVSYSTRDGLECFLNAWRAAHLDAGQIDFFKKLHAFFIKHTDYFIFLNHYIRHMAVKEAAAKEDTVADLQGRVLELMGQPEEIIANGEMPRMVEAFDRFRLEYAASYTQNHQAYYRRYEKKPLSRFAVRAYSLLKRLTTIELLDRPMGMETLFEEIDRPESHVCRRNLAEELIRAPVCGCGFMPGQAVEPAPLQNSEEAIEKYLTQYLQILSRPDIREAISARAFALAHAGPDIAKRLKNMNTLLAGDQASPSAFLDIVDDITADEISKSLVGRISIEKRDISDLISQVGGRRLTKNQVFEILAEWIASPDENTVIAINDNREIPRDAAVIPLSWWTMLHPALFSDPSGAEAETIAADLERQFPADKMRKKIQHLDDLHLIAFLNSEQFHTRALCMAWLTLVHRIISGTAWPESVKTTSMHISAKIAKQIQGRLETLQNFSISARSFYPDSLRCRMYLSNILVDPWATAELCEQIRHKIDELAKNAEEWLALLEPAKPIPLDDNPVVLILDGISPDVWLETIECLPGNIIKSSITWYRLDVPPRTADAVAALFGFDEDAMDRFDSMDISYHQIKGNEEYHMDDLLPKFSPDQPVIVRVALVDDGAHAALLRLHEMPDTICRFLSGELPGLADLCTRHDRRLILTTDHGLSLSRKGLTHGKGTVFERAVFQVLVTSA